VSRAVALLAMPPVELACVGLVEAGNDGRHEVNGLRL
jgi:hypothetical protein